MRICTGSQNQCNRKPNKNCSSKYKGVSWNKPLCKWKASVHRKGVSVHLGYYETKKEAAVAYNEGAKRVWADEIEFLFLNDV